MMRAWPLELVNGTALTGEAVAEKVAALRERVAPDLFAGFRPDRFPASTLPALALSAAAAVVSPSDGERVGLALRDALFEEGRDVSDPEVLAMIARRCGLGGLQGDDVAVERDLAEGRLRGVIGSPYFFVGGAGFFCPALDISRDATGALHVELDASRLDELAEAAFDAGPPAVPHR
jgi:hypothetical protein